MLRYSCADFTFPLLPHDKVLQLVRMLEFDAIDLGIFAGRSHIQPKDIVPDVASAVRRTTESIQPHGLAVSDVFLQTGDDPSVKAANTSDEVVRAENRTVFGAVLEYCAGMQCRHMTGLPGVRHAGVDAAVDWELALAEAHWRTEQAGRVGITYAVEAHVGSICPDPESALRFVEEAGVTLTLDYGHFIYQGRDNESCHVLLPHASHFHARGGKPGGLQTTVKDNGIDFAAIIKRLRELAYKGYVCLEYVWVDWEGCNRTDNLSETLLLRDLLRSSEETYLSGNSTL